MKLFVWIHIQVVLFWICQAAGTKSFKIQIGAIFEHGHDDLQIAFTEAVRRVNDDPQLLRNSILIPKIETIGDGDILGAYMKVCDLLSQGVVAIFGPQSFNTTAHVESICRAVEIPHVNIQLPHSYTLWKSSFTESSYTFNFAPHAPSYYQLFPEIVRKLKWTSFALIYDDNAGLIRSKDLLQVLPYISSNLTVRQLPPGEDFHDFLLEIQKQDQYNIIVDCSSNQNFRLLKNALQVGMMGERYNYLLTNALDAEDKDFEDFRYSKSTIMYTRILNLNNPELTQVMKKTSLKFKTQMMLLYDSVLFFSKVITDLEEQFKFIQPEALCETENSWSNGSNVKAYMQQLQINGLSGSIQLHQQSRATFDVDIMRMEKTGVKKIAKYIIDGNKVLEHNTENLVKPDSTPMLNVLTVLSPPYVMLKNNAPTANNEDIFEGFCIDILEEISKIHGFRYNISLSRGNVYGYIHVGSRQFTGIIGELIKKNVDMGIGDITITMARNQVVDFSYPISDVGITALLRKPLPEIQNNIFYFLTPFSTEIWIALAAAYLGSCVLLFVLARINPTEWQNTQPCDKSPQFLFNNLGVLNSLWFMLASALRQWSTITPKGISTRLVAVIWWIFAIFMFCFYMANLVRNQLLDTEEMKIPIRNINDLVRQSKIKYGVPNGGSTMDFFKNTKMEIYQELWSNMLADKNVFVNSVEEGINRVKQGNYAFFMETTMSEFVSERDCTLMTVGPQLDHKGHAFAFPKGSPYKDMISTSILKLQQTGVLRKLKSKWWEHSKSRGHCNDDKLKQIQTINSRHLGGVFILLLSILPLAFLVAVLEVIWNRKNKTALTNGNTITQEIQQQLAFALNCSKTTKQVPKDQTTEAEESSYLVNEEES